MEKLTSIVSRLFFVGAFVLLTLAVIERIAYEAGYTIVLLGGTFSGFRLLEIAVVLLVFVIDMQLRETKEEIKKRRPGG